MLIGLGFQVRVLGSGFQARDLGLKFSNVWNLKDGL